MADPRRRATAYSNPTLGLAFESLADIFAPPSGSDLYGYTKAGAEREKAQRLADVYRRATSPGASIDALDLPAIAAGLYAPSASGWAVRTKDETDRRGQDITSGDRRYDTDVTARTSRANNADTNRTSVVTTFGGVIPKDGYRPPLPQTVADLYGLPAMPEQRGVIAAQPGERNYLPDGSVLEGAPKPLTETEMNAVIMRDLLTKPEQRAKVMSGAKVSETAQGPMYDPDRVAGGVPEIDKTQPQAFNSSRGPVVWDPVKRAYVPAPTAGGANISSGLQSPAGVQSKDPLGATTANQTDANKKAAQLDVVDQALNQYEDLLKKNPGIVGVPGAVRGAAQNAVSVIQEFGAAFGNTPLDAVITPEQAQQLATKVGAGQRDPAIATARIMQADLAYKWAQMQNPTGEVSRQAFERALETFAGGTLANNQSALEALQAAREVAKRERIGVSSLRNPGGAPAAAAPAGPRVLDTKAGKVTIEQVP